MWTPSIKWMTLIQWARFENLSFREIIQQEYCKNSAHCAYHERYSFFWHFQAGTIFLADSSWSLFQIPTTLQTTSCVSTSVKSSESVVYSLSPFCACSALYGLSFQQQLYYKTFLHSSWNFLKSNLYRCIFSVQNGPLQLQLLPLCLYKTADGHLHWRRFY